MTNDAELQQDLGRLIADARRELRLTQEKLSELVGADLTTISAIEAGAAAPQELVQRLIEVLEGYEAPYFERTPQDVADDTADVDELSIFKTDHEIEAFLQQLLAISPRVAAAAKRNLVEFEGIACDIYKRDAIRVCHIDYMRDLVDKLYRNNSIKNEL